MIKEIKFKFHTIYSLGKVWKIIMHSSDQFNFKLNILIQRYILSHELHSIINKEIPEESQRTKDDISECEQEIIDCINETCIIQNKAIKLYNGLLEKINPDLTGILIPKLPNKEKIENLFIKYGRIKEFSKNYPDFEKYYWASIETLIFKIFSPIKQYSDESDKELKKFYSSFNIEKIPGKYKKDIVQVIDLYLLNYKSTSMLVLGRLFEEIVTKLLLKASKSGNISHSETQINNFNFDTKLNILRTNNLIIEKDYLILKKLKNDRNIGGHFSTKKKTNELIKESEHTIKLAIQLLNKYK